MMLTGAAARDYLRKPDAAHAAILIFGADPMRVADARQGVVLALVGPAGADEMRLTRIASADLRKDPALLDDAIKAQGFFPGHRVALVEDATDGIAKVIGAALSDWQPGDEQVVFFGFFFVSFVLVFLFIALRVVVLARPDRDVMDLLMSLSSTLEPGDFRQTLDKISLYKLGDDSPLTLDDVTANAPQSAEVDVDDLLDIVTAGQDDQLGPIMRNLPAQGVAPVTLCSGATRHFRRVHQVAADPGGPASGVGRLRPPAFGPRRDKIVRQASHWGRDRLERALTALTDVDLQLRSAQSAPPDALLERTMIRLAMMARR